ncbi:MAG: metallophosphoesterase [Xanthobacteraceae bacterium]
MRGPFPASRRAGADRTPSDLVVISGDLADNPSIAACGHLLELLAPLEVAYRALPGNHDDRDLMRAAPGRAASPATANWT